MPEIDILCPRPVLFLRTNRVVSNPAWPTARLRESSHQLLVITGGRIRPSLESQPAFTEPGDIVLYPPGLEYTQETHPDHPLECMKILFHWSECPANLPLVVNDRHGLMRLLADQIEGLLLAGGTTDLRQKQEYLLLGLLGEYLRLSQAPVSDLLRQLRDYALAHLGEPFGLDDLAAQLGLNKYTLIRKVRKVTNRTPMAEVQRLRLERAWQLAAETDEPVKAIARDVGLGSPSHLMRLFRREYRMRIGDVRRAHRGIAK